MAEPDPVEHLIAAVPSAGRRADARALVPLFRDWTGFAPRIWPQGVVGFGAYDYSYASGRSGTWFATGFAPRRAHMVVHVLPGYTEFPDITARLGPHRRGRGCYYLVRLSRIDIEALGALVRAGLADLARHWPVRPA